MATIRSFDKPFELTDYTEELMLVPNTWGLINSMGLFSEEGISQNSVVIEKITGTLSVIPDQFRGARNTVNKDDTRQLLSFPLVHHPLDDAISPNDIQGKRAYGDANAAETEAAVMARKMERIRRNHAITLEASRAHAITNGAIYAPNGTVVGNYYTQFGVTREDVDFDIDGTTTTDVIAKGELVIAHIQDNILSGEVVTGVTVLCSPGFFSKLIAYPTVKEAFQFYMSTQEPLRNRVGGQGLYRRFSYGGVDYVEYRGEYNGTPLIPANEAYAVPMGTVDTFQTLYGPANKLGLVNTIGMPAYMFTYRSPMDDAIYIQSEQNVLNLVRRPQAIVRCTIT